MNQNKNSYIQYGDQLCYAGQINGSKPIGIWRIQVDKYCNNKCLVQTIFLKFKQNGEAKMIVQGQITQISINLIKHLRKQLFETKDSQVSQGELENIAFTKFKERVFKCVILNSEEFNNYLVLYYNLSLNDFYFPNMLPHQFPYFKQLRKNHDGSQVVCFGQYYLGKKQGEFFVKFRDDSGSDFQTIGGGLYNNDGQKHGKWIQTLKTFCRSNQVIFEGEYNNGIKCHQFDIKIRKSSSQMWKKIGGGSYDQQGRQEGAWVEQYDQLSFSEFQWNIIYKNCKQVQDLDIYFLESNGYFKQINNNIYDDYQFSENKWINQKLELIFLKQQILFSGYYDMGKRTGEWKIISQNSVLGGGSYDTNGLKNGKWTQLKDILQGGVLILEIGEYQNGIKTGLWIVKWVEILTKNNKIIGSGNYDNMGIKQGMWQDLIEDFCEQNQLIYKGAYKDGIRIDEWVIQSSKDFPKFCHISQTRTKVRGSGQYDQKGRKIGQWNEPCKNYQQNCDIFQSGNYEKGKKIGVWKIIFKKKLILRLNKEDKIEEIGGGNYDNNGDKIEDWKELSENFAEDSQIILEGSYKNMKKTGKWIAKYRYSESKGFEIIGGGDYEQNGQKSGIWKELYESFSDSCQVREIVQFQNGKKVGRSVFEYRKIHGSQFIQIGEGYYNSQGRKDGNWNELHEKFRDFCQVTKKGQYQNGIKQGDWAINFREFTDQEFIKIGGGCYEKGIKNGQWIDIDQKFCRSRQIIQKLNYHFGCRVGKSEILFRAHKTNEFSVIGEGLYDTCGNKNGGWLEPHQNFWEFFQLYQFGQYKSGVKQGLWQTSKDMQFEQGDIIASGTYDNFGNKDKKWSDLSWNCLLSSFTLSEGEYSVGKRKGEWVLKLQVYDETQLIGSCNYDDNNLKDGLCIDLDKSFFFNKCAYYSTYIHGRKTDDSREFSVR